MTHTKRQQEWEDRVIEACNGTKDRRIDPGICGACESCQSAYGLGEDELTEGVEDGTIPDEGGFSWQSCEVCGSSLGGDRYAAHGIAANGDILHYDICCDCLEYLANGDIPEHAGE